MSEIILRNKTQINEMSWGQAEWFNTLSMFLTWVGLRYSVILYSMVFTLSVND